MNPKDFNDLAFKRTGATLLLLGKKGEEYSTADDKLHNFKQAAALLRCSPEQALWGMLAKHIVSIGDMVAADKAHPAALINEKIGDTVAYLILLEALMKERANA